MCRLFFFRDSPRNAQLNAAQVASDAIGAFAQRSLFRRGFAPLLTNQHLPCHRTVCYVQAVLFFAILHATRGFSPRRLRLTRSAHFAQHAHILLSIFYYIKKEARLQAIGKTISLQLPLFLFSFILNRHSLSVKKFTADFHK